MKAFEYRFMRFKAITVTRMVFPCLLVLAVSHHVNGQQIAPSGVSNAGGGMNLSDHMLILESKKALNGKSDAVIEGTPYLPPDFSPASVQVYRGATETIPARYNACDDNLEYQIKGVTYILDPSPKLVHVKFNNYTLVVDKLPGRNVIFAFYIRLDSGRATLLSRKPIELQAAQAPKALESSGKAARYVPKQQQYFIKIGDQVPTPFNNAKKLADLLPDHKEDIERFISESKLSKGEEDLTKLVAYYNSL